MALAPQQQRQIPYAGPSQQPQSISVSPPLQRRPLDESQEWILFSPDAAPSTIQTHTTSTERTPKTAGRSRLSDFGSLDTAARSQDEADEEDDVTCQGTEIDEEENEELDSLDDGLHAFHEAPEAGGLAQRPYQSGSILPTHDGLGGFRASATPAQEQLWQYERYNPRRRHARRRSSVQKRLEAMESTEEANHENEKTQRIERWRMEQSRALVEEIERETRRQRRMSRVSVARSSADAMTEDQASMSGPSMEEILTRPDSSHQPSQEMESETFWQRFTRRVIHDLIGIDENLLSVIFGETLPPEAVAPTAPSVQDQGLALLPTSSWDHRLLQRIARELGILVHHLSEHPGAFSTYLHTQDPPAYAGLAPFLNSDHQATTTVSPVETNQASLSNPSAIPFAPTLQQPDYSADASMWGIDTDTNADISGVARPTHLPNITEEPSSPPAAATIAQEREYWERELDVKMVFSYLRKRFSSRPTSPEPEHAPAFRRDSGYGGCGEMSTSPESRKRAALIRRHHPLTSRSATAERGGATASRRSELLHRHHLHQASHGYNHGGLAGVVGLRRPGSSSCASQSTRSKKSLSRRSGGSSRNYWDLGGSIGSAGFGSDAGVA